MVPPMIGALAKSNVAFAVFCREVDLVVLREPEVRGETVVDCHVLVGERVLGAGECRQRERVHGQRVRVVAVTSDALTHRCVAQRDRGDCEDDQRDRQSDQSLAPAFRRRRIFGRLDDRRLGRGGQHGDCELSRE